MIEAFIHLIVQLETDCRGITIFCIFYLSRSSRSLNSISLQEIRVGVDFLFDLHNQSISKLMHIHSIRKAENLRYPTPQRAHPAPTTAETLATLQTPSNPGAHPHLPRC